MVENCSIRQADRGDKGSPLASLQVLDVSSLKLRQETLAGCLLAAHSFAVLLIRQLLRRLPLRSLAATNFPGNLRQLYGRSSRGADTRGSRRSRQPKEVSFPIA